jgi:hypothetical protein
MNRYFRHTTSHNSHLYIVDYTEQTKNTPTKKGVEVHTTKPTDIKGLEVLNNNSIVFEAVNLEKNIVKDSAGLVIKQCECMCAAKKRDDEKGWLLLSELKYGLSKNDKSNFQKAYHQIERAHQYLIDKGILSNHNVYYIISLPISINRSPFENFMYTSNELSKLKREKKIIVRGVNKIEVRDKKRLKV